MLMHHLFLTLVVFRRALTGNLTSLCEISRSRIECFHSPPTERLLHSGRKDYGLSSVSCSRIVINEPISQQYAPDPESNAFTPLQLKDFFIRGEKTMVYRASLVHELSLTNRLVSNTLRDHIPAASSVTRCRFSHTRTHTHTLSLSLTHTHTHTHSTRASD